MKKFSLYGKTIEFTDDECNTILLDKEYRKKANEVRGLFLEFFDQNDPLQEDFLERIEEFGRVNIIKYLSPIFNSAPSNTENKFDKEYILNVYIDLIKPQWFDKLEKLEDEYTEILCDEIDMRQYRELRKLNRGRWVGGGFGLKGALAGAAQASLMNAANAGIHSIVNAIGNANSNRKTRNAIRRLFNEDTQDDLAKRIWCCVYDIRIVDMYAQEKCHNKKFVLYSARDYENAELTVKKLKGASKQVIDGQRNVLIQNIKTCPFVLEQYWLLLKNLGDENQELNNILSFLGLEDLLIKQKRKIIKGVADSIKYDSEESLRNGLQQISKVEKFLGYKAPDIRKKAGKALSEIEKSKRTVKDIVLNNSFKIVEGNEITFSSYKETEKAKKIIQDVSKLYNEKVSDQNRIEVENEYNRICIENQTLRVASQVLDAIKKRIDDFEIECRSVKDIIINDKGEISEGQITVYDSFEEAQLVNRIINEIKILYSLKVSNKTESEIRDTYMKICAVNESYKVGLQALEIIKERINKYDRETRTVNGKTYDTREEAELIRRRTFNGVIYTSPEEALKAQKLTYDNILFNSLEEKECYISELKKLKMITDKAITFQEKIEAYKKIAVQQWESNKIQEKIYYFGKEIIEEFEKVMKKQFERNGVFLLLIKSIMKIFALLIIFTISVSFGILGVIIFVIILFATIDNINKNYLQYKKIVKDNTNLAHLKRQIQELAIMTEDGLLIRGTHIYINKNINLAKPERIRYCTNCGGKLEGNWISCPFCGKTL